MISSHDWVAWSLDQARSMDPIAHIPHETIAALSLTASQQRAALRLMAMAQQAGGALLADAPGLGKSRVGLAVAASLAAERGGPLLICAPSRLLPAWRRLLHDADLPVEHALWSHAAMSRSAPPPLSPACILVDEAHHMRNAYTRRASALRAAIGGAAVILLSATPLCREVADVVSLLRLFLQDDWALERVGLRLDDALDAHSRGSFELSELLSLVALRREGDDALIRPSLRLRELPYDTSDAELALWSSLESSLATLGWSLMGERWPRALFIELAQHRWESGPDALAATLADTLAFHDRALQADAMGRRLDPDAFASLFGQSHAQEVLPWCWQERTSPGSLADRAGVLADRAVLAHLHALATESSLRGGRERALIDLLRAEPARWLILTQYEATATALYTRIAQSLGGTVGVGLMTGRAARVTGLGSIDPEDLLARFSPRARQLHEPSSQQAVQLLIATDCMAEGVDLQDCARLILVDLPYAPLVIEQRVGRLVRPGNARREVEVVSLRPRRWNESLGTVRRLTQRLVAADRLGVGMRAASSALNLARADTIGPLEATLWREQLTLLLGPPPDLPIAWRFWQDAGGEGQKLWVFARLTHAGISSPRWCCVEAGHVELRPERLLPGLSALAERTAQLAPWRPGGSAWEAATAALEAQRACIHAAQLAPHRLMPGCIQRRVWTTLCAQGAPLHERAQASYARLMRPLHPEDVAALEHALAADPARVIVAVEALPEPVMPTIELLGGVLC
jgi:hypothetical protein